MVGGLFLRFCFSSVVAFDALEWLGFWAWSQVLGFWGFKVLDLDAVFLFWVCSPQAEKIHISNHSDSLLST